MSNDEIADDKIVELVKQAKHRPLPTSSKVLFSIVVVAMIFTGGIAFEKHRATSTGSSLSLSALGGTGGFGGAAGFGGGTGRNRNGGAGGFGGGAGTATSGGALTLNGGTGTGAGATTTAVAADVAGTVVSITAKSVVIATLSGGNETFPITATTKVRSSTKIDLTSVKPGDIVTVKPDESSNAKTIMVVK